MSTYRVNPAAPNKAHLRFWLERHAKVSHPPAAGPDGAWVAVCQVAGRRWATLEGRAAVRTEPARIAEAERRYAERCGRTPGGKPSSVVIEIAVERARGRG
ncbi:nitrilase [Streptomyces sp. NPDC090499]|uniref:nitrilase n=1 Tax=Streptomyces sp. NPDC090499 TaxID=3365965 RepID=UPI003812F42B